MKRSVLNPHDTQLYNLMCAIEKHTYSMCSRYYDDYAYALHNGDAHWKWHTMSENECIERLEELESTVPYQDLDLIDKAFCAFTRIAFGYNMLGDVMDRFYDKALDLMRSVKRAWEWIDRITERSLQAWRYANKDLMRAA